MKLTGTLLMAPIVMLSACASILNGPDQTLTIRTVSGTTDVAGAQCSLTNNKGV